MRFKVETISFLLAALVAVLTFARTGFAQHEHQHDTGIVDAVELSKRDDHSHDHGHQSDRSGLRFNRASSYLLNLSSGTSINPASWPMPMVMTQAGAWNLMWMGQGFIVSTQQSGPRGGDKVYSANWGMLAAARSIGRGAVMIRTMVSLDPLSITGKQYPLLFQTGETANGKPIVDGQHPHDLLMELSVHYARPIGEKALINVYYAPVGDAALGPVAFPHRASAMELPQAVLSHHWQDSTHIANNVVTAGLTYGKVRIEASGFRGKEPNENRWNIDMGPMDSWSTRLTVAPSRNWVAQVSGGRIRRPEALHEDDVVRTTASLHYTKQMWGGRDWSTSLIWARNYKDVGRYATNAVLAETVLPIQTNNYVTGRFEWSQRDELFEYDHDLAHEIFEKTGKRAFNVTAFTAGYTRDIGSWNNVQTGAGFNVTTYSTSSTLQPFYGQRPVSMNVFLRFRLRSEE
jgi:hypothetical protein